MIASKSWQIQDTIGAHLRLCKNRQVIGFDILGYDEIFVLFTGIPSDTWRADITDF